MTECSRVRTARYLAESPSVQLPGEARVLVRALGRREADFGIDLLAGCIGGAEVMALVVGALGCKVPREDATGEYIRSKDDEGLAAWEGVEFGRGGGRALTVVCWDRTLWQLWRWGGSGAEGANGRRGRNLATARKALTPGNGWRRGKASSSAKAEAMEGGSILAKVVSPMQSSTICVGITRGKFGKKGQTPTGGSSSSPGGSLECPG